LSLKTVYLCADDFGYHSGVSQGILALVAKERLSAVSCMVNGKDFPSAAKTLLSFCEQVQIGLHLNLTEGSLLSSGYSLPTLLLKSHLCPLDSKQIAKELEAQWDAFVAVMGRLPDFIDGHQHVHQFPQIRNQVLALYAKVAKQSIWVRATYPLLYRSPYRFKTSLLALTGGKALYRQLQNQKIPHYACFGGIYDFNPNRCYRTLFRSWLAKAPTNTLLMCHPGNNDGFDTIGCARQSELAYFMSEAFVEDCTKYGVTIGRPST